MYCVIYHCISDKMLTKWFIYSFLKRMLSWICFVMIRARNWKMHRDIIPHLHSKESSLTKHLIRKKGLLSRPFRPPLILRNGYIQTFVGLLYTPLEDYHFDREYLQTTEKSVVALDWFKQSTTKLKRHSPIILIFPRLTGDALSVGNVCKRGASRGMRAVVYNRRGHGSSYLLSANLTSIGDTKDTRKVIEYIFTKYPNVQIVGVGIGAGSGTLFSYLGEFGSSSLMKAAMNISPSYDNTEILCEQVPRLYELYLLCNLKWMLLRNWKALYEFIDLKAALIKSWTLKEFDYQVYCRMYGIETFEDFWRRNDPMRDVDDIAVPVLCINSLDDPVLVKENIPFDLFQLYPNLLLVTVVIAGHCAFYENTYGDSWVNALTINYIEYVLELSSFQTLNYDISRVSLVLKTYVYIYKYTRLMSNAKSTIFKLSSYKCCKCYKPRLNLMWGRCGPVMNTPEYSMNCFFLVTCTHVVLCSTGIEGVGVACDSNSFHEQVQSNEVERPVGFHFFYNSVSALPIECCTHVWLHLLDLLLKHFLHRSKFKFLEITGLHLNILKETHLVKRIFYNIF